MTDLSASWRKRLHRAVGDPELARLAPGLIVSVSFLIDGQTVGFRVREGALDLDGCGKAEVTVIADNEAWARCLESPPPPAFHAFTAWELANPSFTIDGDAQTRAQARAALERIVELALACPPRSEPTAPPRDLTQVCGRITEIATDEGPFDIYYEAAGEGIPVLFLHTAGADCRQFRAQLADPELAARFRMIAPDLPFHGRSLPPQYWDGAPYRLTKTIYLGWCQALPETLAGPDAIVVGGSMGAAIALVLAARHREHLSGVIAIEPPLQSKGRRSPWQNHVAVHGGLHNSAFVRGLMSPTSPAADRRTASWIYSQGAPGIYAGDLAFYSEEFDGARIAPAINARALPVALLSGAYDYSATPQDGARLAELMPGSLHVVMPELGHFPMVEDPAAFRPYLIQALDFVTRRPAKDLS